MSEILTTPYLSLPLACLPSSLQSGVAGWPAGREWGRPRLLNTLLLILRDCVDTLCTRTAALALHRETAADDRATGDGPVWTDEALAEQCGDILSHRLLPCLLAIFRHGLFASGRRGSSRAPADGAAAAAAASGGSWISRIFGGSDGSDSDSGQTAGLGLWRRGFRPFGRAVWDISSNPTDAAALPLEVCVLAHAIEATEKRCRSNLGGHSGRAGGSPRPPSSSSDDSATADEWQVEGLCRRALNEAELHTLPRSLAMTGPGRPAVVAKEYHEAALLRDPIALTAITTVGASQPSLSQGGMNGLNIRDM